MKGDALKEISVELDVRHDVAVKLLRFIELAFRVYIDHDALHAKMKVDIPRCSREHLNHLAKELREYVDEVHRIRCNLPRLLEDNADDGD